MLCLDRKVIIVVYHIKNSPFAGGETPEGLSLRMIEDEHRLDLIKPGIANQCKDKIVLDLGCGTGLLGIHSMDHGAKFVYFVEQNELMVKVLKNALHKIIDPSKFKIIHKLAQDLLPSDFDHGAPELCVSELIGSQLFDEGFYHCTSPIKRMFKDLKFVPEIFKLDVYECDVDFENWPWPQKEKRLLEHYKYMYSTSGWNHFVIGTEKQVNYINENKIGEITYNANTGQFDNSVTAIIKKPINGKMINLIGKIVSGDLVQSNGMFGWYIPPYAKNLEIKLEISKDKEDSRVYFTSKPYKKD